MRRLIEHQVAVRAFGALNLFFDTCPGASASGLFCAITAKSRLKASFLAKEIYFWGKTIYFFLWRCAIFFL